MVALHVRALARNRRHREAVARAGITAAEDARLAALATAHVGGEKVRLLGRHTRAFAVADFFAGGKSRRLAGQRDLQRLFRVQRPGVEQVEIALLVGHILRVGQAGRRVFGGEAGDVVGRLHRLAHRSG